MEGIEGIDMSKGLWLSGASRERYFKILNIFYKDGKQRLLHIKEMPKAEELAAFVTNVHALKGACASIGASSTANMAAFLEKSGKDRDIEAIQSRLDEFYGEFSLLLERIHTFLNKQTVKRETPPLVEYQNEVVRNELRNLLDALKNYNVSKSDNILDTLKRMSVNSEIRQMFETLEDNLLMSEFTEAAASIEEFLKTSA
jgi:HPt (histidine-containing phosphotransfer) domain-containing protein